MPIYFNYLASSANVSEVDYLAFWGYATSAATIITAILGPVLGTVSDFRGWKKRRFSLLSSGRGLRLRGAWVLKLLDLVSADFCTCKGSVLSEPDLL